MPTLGEYRQTYYDMSGHASGVARALALSGIAVVWVFVVQEEEGYRLPRALIWPTAAIVVALAFDLLQYVVSAAIWGTWSRWHERKGVATTQELEAPGWFNWPMLALFIAKISAVVIAYALLLSFLWTQLFRAPPSLAV